MNMLGFVRFIFILLSVTGMAFSAAAERLPRVLLLNSYHTQYQWTKELTRGVQETLASKIPAENLHIEFMDERRFADDAVYKTKLVSLFKHKYRQYSPDLIITSDDYAYDFMIEYGDLLFPGKPMVFSGVNVFKPETLIGRSQITGILEGMEIIGNLELIKTIQPDVKRIVLLGDTTGFGRGMADLAREVKANWQADPNLAAGVSLEIWDKFTLAELHRKVAQLPQGTAILVLAVHKDSQGQYFSYEEQLPILSQVSKVPIYGMWGALMIGKGAVGGLMNDPFEHGASAAKMALEILDGVPIAEVPIQQKAAFTPHFDFAQLTRFDIDRSLLPQGSNVIGEPQSLYQEHGSLINSAMLLLIFLIVVISVLLSNIRKRIAVQIQLDKLNRELEFQVQERTEDLNLRNSQLHAATVNMRQMAFTDPLTELSNRRAGTVETGAYLSRFKQDNLALSVAILDIDFFKRVNDTYGHSCGDEILISFARLLKATVRPSDRLYRWGGEEFLILFPGAEIAAANQVCQRLCHAIASKHFDGVGRVTSSIGVAEVSLDDNLDSLVSRADVALYQAKQQGRNRVCIGEIPQ
jgi:diguanylate cyclase (GGDEF)-like protein